MDRPMIVLLLYLLMMTQAAGDQTLYRTTDARGHVSFSDDPSRGGEPVELAPISVVPSLPPPPASTSTASGRDGMDTPSRIYDAFAIAAPADGATLPTGAAGDVRVRLELRPALREGHLLRLRLDGNIVRPAARQPVIELTNLSRGEHHLRAELLDARGQVLQRTSAVTLYVQRASVNMLRNPHHVHSRPQAVR
ncbi:DUF4124 domain-containing protein [Halomonas caseinilytica]|uniref:DUF4124 domain-containing protein n=1 Tax=Halomonas caseinilytica TaxID=438744 RepID=UPI0007E568E8|nr:DUF4124 domain-containing protein [Halomonas caseinilytica]SEN31359.1 Penicillin-Binding Protein C-terminus Family [Halomonas caseinilytica]